MKLAFRGSTVLGDLQYAHHRRAERQPPSIEHPGCVCGDLVRLLTNGPATAGLAQSWLQSRKLIEAHGQSVRRLAASTHGRPVPGMVTMILAWPARPCLGIRIRIPATAGGRATQPMFEN